MASLIPEITLTDFKRLAPAEIKRLKSCEVTDNGEYLFSFTNPTTDYIRVQTEYNAELSNSIGGETLEQIRATESVAPVVEVKPVEPVLVKPPTRKPKTHRKK